MSTAQPTHLHTSLASSGARLAAGRIARTWLVALPFLAGCLENEEEIEVRPDGSLEVVVRAKGNVSDLLDGYPVPLHGPWVPGDELTADWVEQVGAATGGRLSEQAAEAWWAPHTRRPAEKDRDAQLSARAVFASVDEWSDFLAPASEPYATAYSQRSAELSVIKKSDRTVYVFERVYKRQPMAQKSFFDRVQAAFENETLEKRFEPKFDALKEQLDAGDIDLSVLTERDWKVLAHVLEEAYGEHITPFVRYALEGHYTEGQAVLSPQAVPEIVLNVCKHAEEHLGHVALQALVVEVLELMARKELGEELDEGEPLLRLERRLREGARSTLAAELERHGFEERERNGVLARLEWCYTASDHEGDLGDEEFRVRVRMPGEIVVGNFNSEVDGAVEWKFEGKELSHGDVHMRVVSVL